jgi:hypothetical protein
MFRKMSMLGIALIFLAGCSPQLPASGLQVATTTQIPQDVGGALPESNPTLPPTDQIIQEQGGCTNQFYPIREGATWVYNLSNGSQATHVMSVVADNTFTISIQADSSTFTVDGKCTDSGILLMDRPGAQTTYSGDQGSSEVNTLDGQRVTLPKDIQVGDKWSQTTSAQTGDFQSLVRNDYLAIGVEQISIPAGEFQALKVEQSGYVEFAGQKISMHGFQWFVKGIGNVRSAMDGAPVVELVSFDIPD